MSVVIPHRVNALREVAEATSIKIVADAEAAGKPGSLCVIELHHLLVTTNAKLVGYKKYKRELAQNVVNAAAEEISPATNRHIVEVVRLPMQPCRGYRQSRFSRSPAKVTTEAGFYAAPLRLPPSGLHVLCAR